MTGKTHLTAGILMATYISQKTNLPFSEMVTCYTLSSIGSLFPDIDLASSKLGSKIKPISKVINRFFGHRTFFHAPAIYLLAYFLLTYFFQEYYNYFNYFFIGVATHIGLDILNKKGIPMFYPFSKKTTHLATIKTNGITEYTLNIILIVLICIFLLKNINISNKIDYCINEIKNYIT